MHLLVSVIGHALNLSVDRNLVEMKSKLTHHKVLLMAPYCFNIYLHLYLYLSIYLSIYLSVYLSIYVFIYLYIYMYYFMKYINR